MASRRNRRRIIAGALLLLLALVLVPPLVHVNRYREDLAGALGRALGREVRMGNVSLRALPQPGFEIANLVIMDDPAYSAEPMVQAESVVASLRLSSLFRRRLEISTLSLQYASLNLVRNQEGRWNLEALLTRAAQTPTAPTAAVPEARPRFPYIEAEDARVNFKLGTEKKPYALTQADMALWLEADDQWNMRLSAVPVRTDLPLSDSAELRVTGSVRRAERLRDMLVQFRAEVEGAQMGQITRFLYGHDRGWRGAVDLELTLAGTAADLQIAAETVVTDFRRYDIAGGAATRITARCAGKLNGIADELRELECTAPIGNGDLYVRGNILRVQAQPEFDLSVAVRRVPLASVVAGLRRAKRDLAPDLNAAGEISAAFVVRTESKYEQRRLTLVGGGSTQGLVLNSELMERPLRIGELRFALAHTEAGRPGASPGERLVITPFALDLGGRAPARVQAAVSRHDYSLRVVGDAELRRLLGVAKALGLRPTEVNAAGQLFLDVTAAGPWQDFAPPLVTGRAQLRSVTANIRGIATPVHISGATVALEPQAVRFEDFSASVTRSPLAGSGWVELPRNCGVPEDCVAHFEIALATVSLDEVNRLTNPTVQSRPWWRRLGGSGETRPSIFNLLRAEGTLTSPRVAIKEVIATRVSAQARIFQGKLELTELTGELLGGRHTGQLSADFSADPPSYELSGKLSRANMTLVSAAMGSAWANGPADFEYRVALAGWNAAAMAQSATGTLQFAWRDGGFRNLVLRPGTGPVRVRQFQGRAEIKAARLEFLESKLATAGGIYDVSGTASFNRQVDLQFSDGAASSYAVTGTLAAPRVAAVPRTEAVLRP